MVRGEDQRARRAGRSVSGTCHGVPCGCGGECDRHSASSSELAVFDAEVLRALDYYFECFEAVFGEADWPTTALNLADDSHRLIAKGGTFLSPNVADEYNNWANRGALLKAYRALRAALERPSFRIIPPTNPELEI